MNTRKNAAIESDSKTFYVDTPEGRKSSADLYVLAGMVADVKGDFCVRIQGKIDEAEYHYWLDCLSDAMLARKTFTGARDIG